LIEEDRGGVVEGEDAKLATTASILARRPYP
jgi:hypothetical protein